MKRVSTEIKKTTLFAGLDDPDIAPDLGDSGQQLVHGSAGFVCLVPLAQIAGRHMCGLQ